MKNKALKRKRAQKIICAFLVALACVTAIALCFQFDTSAAVIKLCPNSPDGEHKYDGGVCFYCQKPLACTSHKWSNGKCSYCGTICNHVSFTEDGECATCDYKCKHTNYNYIHSAIDANSHKTMCGDCGYIFGSTTHVFDGSTCSACSYTCTKHEYDSNGECLNCGFVCSHVSYTFVSVDNTRHNLVCNSCGFTYIDSHNYVNSKCTLCAYMCEAHAWSNGKCTSCGYTCNHVSFTEDGECSTCDYKCNHLSALYVYNAIDGTFHVKKCGDCGYNFGSTTHVFNGSTCSACGYGCTHQYILGTCTYCGASCPHNYTIRFDHTVKCSICEQLHTQFYDLDNITYMSSPFFSRYGNSTNVELVPQVGKTDWHIYVTSPSDYSTASINTSSYLHRLDRYIFVKYRVVVDDPTFTTIKLVVGGTEYNCGGVSKGTTFGDWVTVLIDLENIVTSHTFGEYYNISFRFQHKGCVELAYIAMDESITDLCGLLDDKDTYFVCYNESFAPLLMSSSAYRVEYDKNGNNIHVHNWSIGKCLTCGMSCTHSYASSVCTTCGYVCPHSRLAHTSIGEFTHSSVCTTCLASLGDTPHDWYYNYCRTCGYECPHSHYTDGECSNCGHDCPHSWANGVCTTCALPCSHNFINDICSTCGVVYVVPAIDIEDGFLKLITAVFDAQVTTFNSLLNYDIWGTNIANFVVVLVMLVIFGFFIRKFFGR